MGLGYEVDMELMTLHTLFGIGLVISLAVTLVILWKVAGE